MRMHGFEALQSHGLSCWTIIMTPEDADSLPKFRQLVRGRTSKRTWVSSHHTNSAFSTTCSYSPIAFIIHGLVGPRVGVGATGGKAHMEAEMGRQRVVLD